MSSGPAIVEGGLGAFAAPRPGRLGGPQPLKDLRALGDAAPIIAKHTAAKKSETGPADAHGRIPLRYLFAFGGVVITSASGYRASGGW